MKAFNGSVWDEGLNPHCIESLAKAKREIAAWCQNYNQIRLHIGLNDSTPCEFARNTASDNKPQAHDSPITNLDDTQEDQVDQ
ncbi:integrase core domain-containing protein [Achromobacter marplatensis]|uniref:integrase core domain-containing protein n=1 Tax=Achromobacter marplatensis TaxID=470868 RepID=UPI0009D9E93A